ncbi:MAG TPA: DUF3616 domain-containing protein [Polyangiales bacterium]|nr:DUF3616 domain-containing protein [Polyangiales bacterium]
MLRRLSPAAISCMMLGLGCDAHPTGVAQHAEAAAPFIIFRGTCDASAAVPLGATLFAVADDEDNILRVYDAAIGGEPIEAVDVSPALGLPRGRHAPEADIEAATRLGDSALWITSHGLSSRGEHQASRFRFFATNAPAQGSGLAPIGHAYENLLDAMEAAPLLAPFRLDLARVLPPRADGGLNIEGLTRRPDDHSVLIGFRNPKPQGRALLVPLLNPLEIVRGEAAAFGPPQLLDLGGRGIRAITLYRDRYVIAAGASGNEHISQLFVWNGRDAARLIDIDLRDLNPEALVPFEAESRLLVLSDDGTMPVDGKHCKHARDPNKQFFRGMWLQLPG